MVVVSGRQGGNAGPSHEKHQARRRMASATQKATRDLLSDPAWSPWNVRRHQREPVFVDREDPWVGPLIPGRDRRLMDNRSLAAGNIDRLATQQPALPKGQLHPDFVGSFCMRGLFGPRMSRSTVMVGGSLFSFFGFRAVTKSLARRNLAGNKVDTIASPSLPIR